MPAANRRRWSLRIIGVIAAILAFKLFEPLFVYNWGWQQLPPLTEAPITESVDPAYANAAAQAAPLVRELQQKLDLPGISIAIGKDGHEVWRYASGYADLSARKPLTLDAQFRIGSTSKTFTSAAMATLVQAGKVDLDAPLATYLPWLSPEAGTAKVRHAMSHTAGFRDYSLCLCFPIWEYYNTRHFDTLRSANDGVATSPLRFAPGSAYAYTSLGYNLTGSVIESVTQQDFLAYLQHAVLDPLQLTQTRADDARAEIADRVVFYEVKDDEYKPVFGVDNSNKWPSGGMLSTPRDLVRFGNAMLAGTLIDTTTRDRFWTVQKLADGSDNPDYYALGWRIFDGAKRADGTTTVLVSHNGVATGATSRFALYPREGLVIAILTNAQQSNTEALNALSARVVEAFLGTAPSH